MNYAMQFSISRFHIAFSRDNFFACLSIFSIFCEEWGCDMTVVFKVDIYELSVRCTGLGDSIMNHNNILILFLLLIA